MAGKLTKRKTKTQADDLMRRLQGMVYEFHELGHFEDARPHLLWLMEIAEKVNRKPASSTLNS